MPVKEEEEDTLKCGQRRRLISSGALHRVAWWIVTDVSKNRFAVVFRVKQSNMSQNLHLQQRHFVNLKRRIQC